MTVDRQRECLLFLLASVGYASWHGMLMAHNAPAGRAAWERMEHPEAGDLVLEQSTVWHWFRGGVRVRPGAIGVLVRKTREQFPGADDGVLEDVWYINALDGTGEARWTNARFIALIGVDEKPLRGDAEPLASLLALVTPVTPLVVRDTGAMNDD